MESFKKDHWDQHADEIIKLQAVSTADQMQVCCYLSLSYSLGK